MAEPMENEQLSSVVVLPKDDNKPVAIIADHSRFEIRRVGDVAQNDMPPQSLGDPSNEKTPLLQPSLQQPPLQAPNSPPHQAQVQSLPASVDDTTRAPLFQAPNSPPHQAQSIPAPVDIPTSNEQTPLLQLPSDRASNSPSHQVQPQSIPLQQPHIQSSDHRSGPRSQVRVAFSDSDSIIPDGDKNFSCDSFCSYFCLPCADRACFTIWQVIAWIGLLILTALTVYGPILCTDDFRDAGIIVLFPFVLIALLSLTCLMNHCCCANRDQKGSRVILGILGFFFVVFFFIATAAGTYMVFIKNQDSLDDIIRPSDLSNKTDNMHCKFLPLLFADVMFSYAAIIIYIVLWISCISVQQSIKNHSLVPVNN